MRKVYDRKGRHRNVVTSFRMSQAESDLDIGRTIEVIDGIEMNIYDNYL